MSHRTVRNFCRISAVLLLAIGVGMWPASRCDAAVVGDMEVIVQPLPTVEGGSVRHYGVCHGYVEYRVQLKNRSDKDHTVELIYPAESPAGRMAQGVVATRTVEIAAKQEVSVSLYQPFSSPFNDSMTVRVEGEKEDGVVRVGSLLGYRYDESSLPSVLASRNIPRDFRDRGHAKVDAASGLLGTIAAAVGTPSPESAASPETSMPSVSTPPTAPEVDPFTLLRSEVPVSQWSTNWLGYSAYDAILLTQQEAEEMPADVQGAIRRYLECGGVMVVHGRSVPAVFSQGGIGDNKKGYAVGLGLVTASAPKDENDWDATYQQLAAPPLHIYQPIEKPGNLHELLLAESPVPVRGLFVLVLLFSLVIGPLNVWLLSIYKRRIWLWWNVPAISLVTCVLIFGYAAFSDGFTARGKVASLTFLDERCHHATTIGHMSYYCPLTPSAGLQFTADTDVSLLQNASDYRRSRGRYSQGDTGRRRVDWTNQQHLVSGWVAARIPAYLQIRKNEDRRERLTIEKQADGSLAVVNALGEDVSRLLLADASGRMFEVRDIPAGAKRTLATMGEGKMATGHGQADLRQIFMHADWLGRFRDLADTKDFATVLAPGSYIAFMKKSPFIESPLARADSVDTLAIVCGISKGADDGR